MFEALSRRLEAQGSARWARVVAFEAEQGRRTRRAVWCSDKSAGTCLTGEAEWWLWTLPTRNGSDPTALFAALALLWGLTVAAGIVRGRILVLPRVHGDEASAVYAMPFADQIPEGTYCPLGTGRAREAVRFANGLVLKLGTRRARFAAPVSAPWHTGMGMALWIAWLLGWTLLAALAAVLATSFPGLEFLKAAG
jgi:hypothetical protein